MESRDRCGFGQTDFKLDGWMEPCTVRRDRSGPWRCPNWTMDNGQWNDAMQRLCSAALGPGEEGNDGEKNKIIKHTHCGRGRWHSRFPQHLHFHWPVPFGSPAGNQKAAGRTLASAGALLSPCLRGVKRTDLASFSPGQWSSSKPHPRTGIGKEMPMLRVCSLPSQLPMNIMGSAGCEARPGVMQCCLKKASMLIASNKNRHYCVDTSRHGATPAARSDAHPLERLDHPCLLGSATLRCCCDPGRMIDSARVGEAAAANNGCVGSLDGHDGLQHSLHHAAQS